MGMANKTHNHVVQVTGKIQGISHHYSRGLCPENFFRDLINNYINTMAGPKMYMHYKELPEYRPQFPQQTAEKYPRGIHLGSTTEEIMQALGETNNVILNFTTERGYGHAACLKMHNQQWYLQDSENSGPINLDKIPSELGWQKVAGHTYILTAERPNEQVMDRFNPHGTNYTNPHQTGTIPDTPPPKGNTGMEIQGSSISSPQRYTMYTQNSPSKKRDGDPGKPNQLPTKIQHQPLGKPQQRDARKPCPQYARAPTQVHHHLVEPNGR